MKNLKEQNFLLFLPKKKTGNKTLKVKENQKGVKAPMLLKKNLSEIVHEEAKKDFECNEVLNEVFTLENLPIKKAIFIDSTWSQCKSIFRDERLAKLTTIVIQNRETRFWRPNQKDHPKWFLSTIEAIHQFLVGEFAPKVVNLTSLKWSIWLS